MSNFDEALFLMRGMVSFSYSDLTDTTATEITLDDIEKVMSKYEKEEKCT